MHRKTVLGIAITVLLGAACSCHPTRSLTNPHTDLISAWYPDVDKSTVYLRFPELANKRPQPRLKIEENSESIALSSEITRVVFKRSTCAVNRVIVRGRDFNEARFPDLQIRDTVGELYFQSYAQDGDLKRGPDVEGSLCLEGQCHPQSASGNVWASPVRFRYIIHPVTGMVRMQAEVLREVSGAVEVTFVNTFNDVEADEFDQLFYMHGRHKSVYKEIASRADAIENGDRSARAMWCAGGKMAFHVESMSLANSQIAESVLSDPVAYKYATIETRRGARIINQTFVNMPQGTTIMAGATYEYGFSVLPMVKFKPYLEFFGDIFGMDTEQEMRQVARSGMTCGCLIMPYAGGYRHTDHGDRLASVRLARKFGMKVCSYFEVNLLPYADEVVEKGFYTKQEMGDAQIKTDWAVIGYNEDGKSHSATGWPNANPASPNESPWGISYPGLMCHDGGKWPHYIASEMLRNVDRYDLDGVYADGLSPFPCNNTAHGCSAATNYPVSGGMQLLKFVRDGLRERPGQRFFWTHVGNDFGPSVSSTEFYNPGEETGGAPLSPTQLDCIYNPLLYGSQASYHTGGGGMPHSDPSIYEIALARCSLVWMSLSNWPGRFKPDEITLYQRYMCPLKTFDVENAEVHHPYDQDFERYASCNLREVTPVLYTRPGDVLLTTSLTYQIPWVDLSQPADADPQDTAKVEAAKTRARVNRELNVEINLKELGLPRDTAKVILFDTVGRKLLPAAKLEKGWISLKDLSVGNGPAIIRIMKRPAQAAVVWRDPLVWRVLEKQRKGKQVRYELAGMPGEVGKVIFYLPAGKEISIVEGGTMNRSSGQERLRYVNVPFSEESRATLRLAIH